jgi:hypothetical protein
MRVIVENIYTDSKQTFSGEPTQIRNQLNAAFPFLKRYKNASLQEDLSKISQQQAFMVNVEQE